MKALLDPWWAQLASGEPVGLAFIKLDRVGSTLDWRELPDADVQRRRQRFVAGVEQLAMDFGAVQPLHWQGDGVLLVLPCRDDAELLHAWHAARALWVRQTIELSMPTRIAMHAAAEVPWDPDTGKLAHPAIDLCGHLEHDTPEKSVAVTEDVALALPDGERRALGWLGLTKRDGVAAYVFPAASADRRKADAVADEAYGRLWRSVREYANGATVRRLRYAGLKLTKKEPPSLDVLRVFVAPRVALRQSAFDIPFLGESGSQRSNVRAAPVGDATPGRIEALRRIETLVDLTEALRRSRALVVLGGPGSGKTTLLRWLAVVAAGGRLTFGRATGCAERLLPLPVSVGRLAEIRASAGGEISVVDALARYFDDRSVGQRDELAVFLRATLDAGECLVLLDGLDEVKSADRLVVAGWLESFAANAGRNRFVVTSRPTGYTGFALPNGVEVTVQPFDDSQVERYVTEFQRAYLAWETNAEQPTLAEQQARDLLQALRSSPRLRDLARHPFLLAVLALIHRAEGRLPRHRVQAYHVFAQALCETWGAARRLVASPSPPAIAYEEEALPVLGELAIAMHAEYADGLAPEAWMLTTLARTLVERRGVPETEAARAALEFLTRTAHSAGILVERAPGHWGFLHLTFEEYFVAVGLHAQERFEEQAFRHLFDPRWEEVLRLGVGQLALVQGRAEAARRIVRRVLQYRLEGELSWLTDILKQQIPLAALLAAEAGEALPPAEAQQVVREFIDWLLHVPPDGRDPAFGRRHVEEMRGTTLAHLLACELASRLAQDAMSSERIGWLAEILRADELVPVMLSNLEARRADLLDDLIGPLGWLKVDAAVPILSRLVTSRDSYATDALFALANIGTPAALASIEQALECDDARIQRRTAEALGQVDSPEARSLLRVALRATTAEVRIQAALSLLAWEPEHAIPLLRDELEQREFHTLPPIDPHPVAESAIPALLVALDDSCKTLRRVAALYLVRSANQRLVSASFPYLEKPDPITRKAVLDAVARAGCAPSVGPVLACLEDADPVIRQAAAEALRRIGAAAAGPALERRLADEVPGVRLAAATALAGLGCESGEAALVEMLKDGDPGHQRGAALALGEVGTSSSASALIGSLRDDGRRPPGDGQDVRSAVVVALGRLGAVEAVPHLLALHRSAFSHSLKEAAQVALWRILEKAPIT